MTVLWREPYRGSRYSFDSERVFYRIPTSSFKEMATSYSNQLLDALLDVKPDGGSFRITETKAIITKLQKNAIWTSEKVCDYDASIRFSNVNINPDNSLRPGDIWPGFYYRHGASYSLSFSDDIFIHLPYSNRCWVLNPDTNLIGKLRVFLPKGGRFYINENGHVWTNSEIIFDMGRVENQVSNFTALQKTLLNQRIISTGLYPVYVGKWESRFALDLEDFETASLSGSGDEYD